MLLIGISYSDGFTCSCDLPFGMGNAPAHPTDGKACWLFVSKATGFRRYKIDEVLVIGNVKGEPSVLERHTVEAAWLKEEGTGERGH
jgi:hypothetical protein